MSGCRRALAADMMHPKPFIRGPSGQKEIPDMSRRRSFPLLALIAVMAFATTTGAAPRIVTIGGPVTEIVYALGAGGDVVGVDTSSTYPETATRLPQVGYQRRLSAEGVLSLQPDVVLVTSDAGPAAALEQLKTVVEVVEVSAVYTIAGAEAKIRLIAGVLGREAQGEQLVAALGRDLAAAQAVLDQVRTQPRVLFLYARGLGTLYVSGTGTAVDAMIRLAGGVNAVTEYEDFKPFTSEAVVAAAPEVLLLLERGLDSLGGVEGLLKLPGMALTEAARQDRIVAMDDLYLSSFGPRLGAAVKDLAIHLHPELHPDPQ